MQNKKILIFIFIAFAFLLLAPVLSSAQTKEAPFVPLEPKLQIPIPDLIFSKIVRQGQLIGIPYLADYIAGVYKYAVGIVSFIAIVFIMVGGLRWMTAGGNASAITSAKEMISGAVIGLFIALGSYLVLYTINPDLVSFKNLQIKLVQRQELEIIDKGQPGEAVAVAKNPKPLSNATFDNIFKKYAPCASVDWRVLKVMAYKESSLDPTLVNQFGYTGLFQFKTETCPKSLGSKCNNLTDPDNNTAAGAIALANNINAIKGLCPSASPQIFFTLAYMAHNSGLGAVYCATRDTCNIETKKGQKESVVTGGGCSLEQIKQGIITFWNNHYKSSLVPGRGLRTYNYSVSTANLIISQGVTQTTMSYSEACPI